MADLANYTRVFLNRGEEKEKVLGFPWIYDNEISHVKCSAEGETWQSVPLEECTVKDGSPCEVFTKSGAFIGTGILNRASRMTVRLIASDRAAKVFVDKRAFWMSRITDCYNVRRLQYKDSESYRLVFAEADLAPGLIVDRFCTVEGRVVLVVQFLALAAEVFRADILYALKKVTAPDAIYERDDNDVRGKEGLDCRTGWLLGGGDATLIIEENGVQMEADIEHGQKTGYFLDQKSNHAAAAKFCHGKRVLDAFCHTGGFAMCAAKAGAREVVAVDIEAECTAAVERNARRNGLDSVVKAQCADVFDLLKAYEEAGEKFDVIILDPPAFTKSSKTINKAYSGYKEINLRAMRLLRKSGILVTCSCSYFFDEMTFYSMLTNAASDCHRRVQILDKRGAGGDHPVLLGHSRSEYLKCAIARVM